MDECFAFLAESSSRIESKVKTVSRIPFNRRCVCCSYATLHCMAVILESAVEDRSEEAPGREGMRRECRKAFCVLCFDGSVN